MKGIITIRSYCALNGVNVGVPDFEKGLAYLDRLDRRPVSSGATSNPGYRP